MVVALVVVVVVVDMGAVVVVLFVARIAMAIDGFTVTGVVASVAVVVLYSFSSRLLFCVVGIS